MCNFGKTQKLILLAFAGLISFSIFYSLVLVPLINQVKLGKCLEDAENITGIAGLGKTSANIRVQKEECVKIYGK